MAGTADRSEPRSQKSELARTGRQSGRGLRWDMAKRHPNYRLAKIHHNYTVAEIAKRLGVHRNTVREWIRCGLPTIDHTRPTLILGDDLRTFLKARRLKHRRPCRPGEIYCVRCRVPRTPAGNSVIYQPQTDTLGSLVGLCSECDTMIYRRVNPANIEQVRGKLEVVLPKASRHLDESAQPFVNHNLRDGTGDHEEAQRC